jgi:hypothetical protein
MFGCDENEYIVILFPHFNLWCSFWWSPSGGFVLIPVIPLVCFLLHPNWTHANMGNWLMCVDYQQPKSTSFQSFTTCKQSALPEWCFKKPPCTSREWEIALWRSPNWGSNVELMMKLFCLNNLKCTRWNWPESRNFLGKLNMTSIDEVPWIIWIRNNECDIMRQISISRTSFEDPWMKLTAVNEMDWQFNVLKTNEMIDEHS